MAIFLAAIYLVLVFGDFFETRYAVSRWGHEVESNPLWQAGFRRRSAAMDWLYLAGALAIGGIVYWLLDVLGLSILIAVFALTNCNNLIAILRMRLRERTAG